MTSIPELKVKFTEAQQAEQEAWKAHSILADQYERGEISIEELNAHLAGCQAFQDEREAAWNELQDAEELFEHLGRTTYAHFIKPELAEFYSE